MDGRQRRIGNVERSYERSRLESQLLADAYRRVLPPKQFRLAQRDPQEGGRNRPRNDEVSEAANGQSTDVKQTESLVAMEGAVA